MEQYLVFDIETAPLAWDTLDEAQHEYLLRRCETDEEIEKKKFEMALSPMTAHVACIGLQLMQAEPDGTWTMVNRKAFSSEIGLDEADEQLIPLVNDDECIVSGERELLQKFWAILKKYDQCQLISFNGRNFDAPFLMLRSAMFDVRPSRNIMSGTKFNYSRHIDLIDELTFFQASQYGATKRFNFDFYTRAFGIKSPKSEGVDGSMVGEMYHAKKTKEIAEYCLRDINATWELFLKWYHLLKF